MKSRTFSAWFVLAGLAAALSFLAWSRPEAPVSGGEPGDVYAGRVRPLLQKYCYACHSTKAHKGELDLERFGSLEAVRKDVKPWPHVIEQLEAGEMPPKGKPQPSPEEIKTLVAWARGMLDAEARARSGDPGHVPLRRLSNTEYDCTIRDLTGVDLKPAREFPADGAGGEGFTNAAESLSDVTPALFNRYLKAAKEIGEHAVLLPDGFRFSAGKTRRDWTDESLAALRKFYADYVTGDGKLAVQPYLSATIRHRDALRAGMIGIGEVAAKEKLHKKYLETIWQTLTDKGESEPLAAIRARWRTATEKEAPALAAEVVAWQEALWKTAKIGSYMTPAGTGYVENLTRQVPNDPPAVENIPLRVSVKPPPGAADITLYLAARPLAPAKRGGIVWTRPRFEGPGKPPLLLRDYAEFGPAFELDYPSVFVNAATYLAAVQDAATDTGVTLVDLARKHALDPAFLQRWIEVAALEPRRKTERPRTIPAVPLTLLEERTAKNEKRPTILGWHKKGTDLPVLVTNTADAAVLIPGRISGHGVGVHPMPKEFVAVAWKSPVEGSVRVTFRVTHAHPACGNGVAWWLEQRRGAAATVLGEGTLDLGKEITAPARILKVAKGDVLVLAVDARDGDHVCDMTDIAFSVAEDVKEGRAWDLAKDVVDTVTAANPHADKHGNADTWSFAYGPSKGSSGGKAAPLLPPGSVLGRWRGAVADPERQAEAAKLAGVAQALLSGPRPADEKSPDRLLYDKLVSVDSPLFTGVEVKKLAKPRATGTKFGLAKERFGGAGTVDAASLSAAGDEVIRVTLPAALFQGREFVVEARIETPAPEQAFQVRVAADAPGPTTRWDGAVLGSPASGAYKRLLQGAADFRAVFPLFLCFPVVVPTDEVVSLKMFHREDEPLLRLFLDDAQARRLERLWSEQRFVSRQAVAENDYLPQFIGFVTQDQPKSMVAFFEGQRPAFKKRAVAFLAEEEAAIPKQMEALLDFAGRAYRRPLQEKQKAELLALYEAIRKKGAGHDEAFRGVLTRVLVSPAFLFRIEKAPPGAAPGLVDDHELASRLSYFLWSSAPDDELRRLASAGKLRDLSVLEAQTRRMLKDDRARALAIEFGTQWIHVRGFEGLKEKNEKLFPTFNAALREVIYEESILFFLDLFQSDRPVTRILDADYTFLNETLARHYGIPGVSGPAWRKVDGVRKYGRGGVLGLASVHAKQSGASRTSPVLRGNWVVETLLGEKLPRPPADVPILPDEEGGADKRTTRQMVEKHTTVASCAVCHVRIDPYGFAFENFDAIGRWRTKESGGLPIDARSKLKDGTEFEGIEGLRLYLLTKKRDVIVRLFCQRLLGYALGRATTLSDATLIDDMVSQLAKNEERVTAAVLAIVRSPQFRMIRGAALAKEER
ncbi:MAG: DUF1592 domain-containing protein [Gemmataceae bacterium]